ncbi:golgi-body localization protein domain-containing protein [Choanephora cucurbitarum]|nr:golgi-body localization protein domain-containing protein [Choanephora cucurbitarum]
MSLNIYHCIVIVLALWVLRLFLRTTLAFRFHFCFGRIGFFSISDVQYHHHKSSETALWSVKIGKVKLRMQKRPTLNSPVPFITLYVSGIDIQVHNLAALVAHRVQRKQQKKQHQLSKRFSRVSHSLNKIPWWYSLSVVKQFFKITSALPAQLLMAGLANYVDVHLEDFCLKIEEKAKLKVKNIKFSSVLFANIAEKRNESQIPNSIPSRPRIPNKFRKSYQRHSLKRAEHLFKEKFFEIRVDIGAISLDEEQSNMLALPSGGHVSVSCHFSAGCVTLKDIDINTRIDKFHIHLNPIVSFIQYMKQFKQKKEHIVEQSIEDLPKNRKSMILQVLRSASLTIEETAIKVKHTEDVTTNLVVNNACFNVLSEANIAYIEPYYKINNTYDSVAWDIFDPQKSIRMMHIPSTRLSASISHSLFSSIAETELDSIPSDFDHRASLLDDLKPNKRYVNISLAIDEPLISLDIRNKDLIEKLKSKSETTVKKDTKRTMCTFKNLPRSTFSFNINHPSIKLESGVSQTGVISWSVISFQFDGQYTAQKNRPRSIIPRAFKPVATTLHDDEQSGSRANSTSTQHSRTSWTNLFRRSWRMKDDGAHMEKASKWYYTTSFDFSAQNNIFDIVNDDAPVKRHPYFFSIEQLELKTSLRMDVSFEENPYTSQQIQLIWDLNAYHIGIEAECRKPVLNLWIKLEDKKTSQLEYWVKEILAPLSSAKRQKEQKKDVSQDKNSITYDVLSVIKMQVNVLDTSFVFEGLDRGIKGHREVPDGYLDNAPTKDIDARIALSVAKVSWSFNGSRVFGKRKHKIASGEVSAESDHEDTKGKSFSYEESNQTAFGTSRLSLQHIVVDRYFNINNECDWKHDGQNRTTVMWISRVNTRTEYLLCQDSHCVNVSPSVVIKKIGLEYSITNHYACLVTALSTLNNLKRLFPKKDKGAQASHKAKRVSLQDVQFQLNRADVHVYLPGGQTELYLRTDNLRTHWKGSKDKLPRTVVQNITLFGAAPYKDNCWDQLVEIDSLCLSVEKPSEGLDALKQLSMAKLYLRIPYGYEMCNVLDGTVTLMKGIKATHARLLKDIPFLFFGPSEKKEPAIIQPIRLMCNLLTVQFEDDPFEARLRMIWRTGVAEQVNRIAIQDAFEAKAQALLGQSNNGDYTNEDISKKLEADARVSEAWQGLQKHNSKSWKRHIDSSLSKELSAYDKIQEGHYRHSAIAGQLDESSDSLPNEEISQLVSMFCIDIVDLPKYPPLLNFTIKNSTFDFRPPEFDLSSTRQFMHDVGKGQPLDKPSSTMIPFYLHWKAGETWAQIRDYPLPIFLVPSDNSRVEEVATSDLEEPAVAWSLSGNYVLADDMGDLEGTRQIHILMIDEDHTGYAIDIARTSTPLKFYSIVNIDVHNSSLSQLCWSIPYQPAIQDIMRVLDTFTKPPADPSDKVGFWDKLRLIIHTRAKISFTGGGDLAIVMKGSRDPYDISEKGFGLAKVWRNDVVCLLGHENNEGEFMQIISGDYAFGVPDLVHGGYIAPYVVGSSYPIDNTKSGRARQSFSSFNSSNLSKDRESRFVKIALKLSGGIRMGIGCVLERACHSDCNICDENNADISSEERNLHKQKLLEFLPHYHVKLKAPQHVHEKDYDAYKGFRSDFIHFSISIIKLSPYEETDTDRGNVVGNSMHLSPGFMDHFVSWFRLFGGAMSYPLRSGSLFPKLDKRASKKFGRHMKTMKYKIVVNPLTIGYFLKDSNIEAENIAMEETGDVVGLKGFVKNFSVDMHMQREIINISDYKLDQKRLKANWPIAEAEVQLRNVDLRAVLATYLNENNNELVNSLDNMNGNDHIDYMSDSSDHGLNMMEGLNYKFVNDSESADWVDLDDFIEMGIPTPHALPNIQVLPFSFIPRIHYLRQTNRDEMEKYKYLRKTHDCIFGSAASVRETQMELLRDRSKSIDVQIRKHQTRLHNIESKRLQHGSDEKSLEEMSDAIVDKTRILYEKRELLQKYLRELSMQSTSDMNQDDKSGNQSYSSIFGKDSLTQWEELLGPFKQRYILHNPQIVWNNSVRNVLYHAMDLRDHRRALSYYMTARTIKFLRDLIDTADNKYNSSHKQFDFDSDEGGMDNSMAEELIAKLLEEQSTKFYVPNETDEEKATGSDDFDEVDMSLSDNVNSPSMQLKSIPRSYKMKTSYLIDLLNPQISLQSDCDPNNIVLVANERTQVKGLNIVDETDPDIEMEMVKHRTVVSLQNVQFFVAKKEQFDSVDLLLDNHYGAKDSDHWLTWIPPEMLISYAKGFEQFQRIGDRIEATLQYDKYNPLRIKMNSTVHSQDHPFEDYCDSVQLNFPNLKLVMDSAQYNAIYQVATDLLLYKEPAKKERLARLREIMMAADRASPYEVTEKIVELQNRARQLIAARDQYRQIAYMMDEKHIEELKSIRLDLFDTQEELYLGMEAIKLMQSNHRKEYDEHKINLKFVFCAQKIEWEMLSKGDVPLCECTLNNLTFNFVSKEDHSSSNTLEVDLVQVKNVSPSPVFVDVLGPYFDSRKPYDFSRHKMLRCYFVSLAPVGGIPVIQHLEINLHPMRVQMTYSFGKALAYYLFPPEKSQKQIEATHITTSISTPTIALTTDSESAISDLPASSDQSQTGMTEHTERNAQQQLKSNSSAANGANQSTSAPTSLSNNIPTLEMSKMNAGSTVQPPLREDDEPVDNSSSSRRSKRSNQQKLSKNKASDDLSVMKKRASSNRTFILVKIPGARHCLSYQGAKEKNIEDLRDFAFEQPKLEFRNETWSWFELASNIKKDFMKAALLHNSTALLKEKLLRRHPRENNKIFESTASLNGSISNYNSEPNSRAFDVDNISESSRDDIDDYIDIKDTASLHSAHSQELSIIEPEAASKKSHLWSKLKKPKKAVPEHQKIGKLEPSDQHMSAENLSLDRSEKEHSLGSQVHLASSAQARSIQENDQLTIKGRYLLGKYYNGPTQWLASGRPLKTKSK